jgi:hypothetical protein
MPGAMSRLTVIFLYSASHGKLRTSSSFAELIDSMVTSHAGQNSAAFGDVAVDRGHRTDQADDLA